MKRKNAIVLCLALPILTGAGYLLTKPASLDFSNDEEPFRSISMPIRKVLGNSYMDGGSVTIRIVDHAGKTCDVTFPINYHNVYDSHPTAFSGTFSDGSRVSLKDPARAKSIALRLLREFPQPIADPEVDLDVDDMNEHTRRILAYPPANALERMKDKVMKHFL